MIYNNLGGFGTGSLNNAFPWAPGTQLPNTFGSQFPVTLPYNFGNQFPYTFTNTIAGNQTPFGFNNPYVPVFFNGAPYNTPIQGNMMGGVTPYSFGNWNTPTGFFPMGWR